jgi:hypothetical protein
MKKELGLAAVALALVALVVTHEQISRLWAAEEGARARILITDPIDEGRLITLRGNTRPEAKVADYDRGRVEDDFPMEGLLFQLKRPIELEQAFEQYIDSLTDKSSPNFHHWLMADEQGQKYGLAQEDIDAIASWLSAHGFTVNGVYPNRMVIDFSGTAGEIREAFHTEIHYLDVRGESHFANVSDPQIPEALAPAVVGVVSMHNFKPHPMLRSAAAYTFAGCSNTTTFPTVPGTCYALVPADFATIYNLNPLFREGIQGQGQTITVVEDSNTYGTDVSTYRSTFLSKYSLGTFTTTHPTGSSTCTNPNTNEDDSEADLDAEVASAIAPGANIQVAACADSGTTNGVLIATQNLVNSSSPPAIISMSYGECEAYNGATSNAAYNTAFQTGAAAGVSIFVSTGDDGAGGCAPLFSGEHYDYAGIGITGWGETVYNVSVGGTDFEDTYNSKEGGNSLSTYWNSSNAGTTDGSAKSYIPEIPWNDSCASVLISNVATGSYTTYGTGGFCNSSTATTGNDYLTTSAGAGGPSACATGGGGTNQTSYAEVDGSCTGYPKPSWQSGIFGNPADGVRDIPDVSLFASNGIWGHYVIICWDDPSYTSDGAASCSGAPSTWSGFGGTSVATPMMAAIQALVNQKWGNLWQGSWLASHSYALNALITDSNANVEQVTTAGTSGSSAPTWNTSLGGTTTDNTVTWTNRGKAGTWQASRVYALNTVITDSNGNEEQVTTAGTSGTTAPSWNTTVGGTTTDNTVTWTNRGVPAASRSGNPDPIYYSIAKSEFGSSGNSACYSINQPARRGLASSCAFYDITQGDNDVNCLPNGTTHRVGCYVPSGTNGVLSTQALTTGTVTAAGSGYTGTPTCALGAPSNLSSYLSPSGTTLWSGGTKATCTLTKSGNTIGTVTISGGGQGYAGGTSCTISGGGGSGATCSASPSVGTAAPAYQPAYGATPGWDFATGIGSVNAYNLVFSSAW